jgi:hypothetical protein
MHGFFASRFALASRLTAFYEARLRPGEDISVLLRDDARRTARSPSAGDAQLFLDVGHHRVRQARFAEFREVFSDGALP